MTEETFFDRIGFLPWTATESIERWIIISIIIISIFIFFLPQTIVFDRKCGGRNSSRDKFLRFASFLLTFERMFEIVCERQTFGCFAGGNFLFLPRRKKKTQPSSSVWLRNTGKKSLIFLVTFDLWIRPLDARGCWFIEVDVKFSTQTWNILPSAGETVTQPKYQETLGLKGIFPNVPLHSVFHGVLFIPSLRGEDDDASCGFQFICVSCHFVLMFHKNKLEKKISSRTKRKERKTRLWGPPLCVSLWRRHFSFHGNAFLQLNDPVMLLCTSSFFFFLSFSFFCRLKKNPSKASQGPAGSVSGEIPTFLKQIGKNFMSTGTFTVGRPSH